MDVHLGTIAQTPTAGHTGQMEQFAKLRKKAEDCRKDPYTAGDDIGILTNTNSISFFKNGVLQKTILISLENPIIIAASIIDCNMITINFPPKYKPLKKHEVGIIQL